VKFLDKPFIIRNVEGASPLAVVVTLIPYVLLVGAPDHFPDPSIVTYTQFVQVNTNPPWLADVLRMTVGPDPLTSFRTTIGEVAVPVRFLRVSVPRAPEASVIVSPGLTPPPSNEEADADTKWSAA
jgi:hypothetical protein